MAGISNDFKISATIRLMNSLSVVINAQNAEKDLPRAFVSIKSLADEVVVVDQESTDKTTEIAKKFGAKVFTHKHVEYVELARNFAISKASKDWILILDPDEEISETLVKKIKEIVEKNDADFCRIPRKNIIFGKWIEHTAWWPDYQIRLFKKGKTSWNEMIHSVPLTIGKGTDLPAEEKFAIIHHNYNSVEQYLERLNRYTSVQSELLSKDGYEFSWKDLIDKPFREFINRYFVGEGYKDGLHGLVLSFLQAFSELIVYVKIWQMNKFKEERIGIKEIINEMGEKEKELHFWQNDTLYKETKKISYKLRRKLKI